MKTIRFIPNNNLKQTEQLEQLRWLVNGANIHVIIIVDNPISIDKQENLEKAIKIMK